MKVFAVVVEEHHTGIDVELFWHKVDAIAYAKAVVNELDRDNDADYTLYGDNNLWQASFGCEGDFVFVIECGLK